MSIKINISSNVQNHTWSGIASHVERNYLHDSNTGINPEYTKYNEMLSRTDLKPLIQAHFADLVRKHDNSKSVKKNPKRAYKSVKNYLHRRRGNPESTIVLKIGTQADKARLVRLAMTYPHPDKSKAINEIKKANDYAFKLYIRGYKQRHPTKESSIPMGHAETNEDEQGADHLHYNIADLGFTKKGNASMGFSRAICNEYHTDNRIKAMKMWHQQEDSAMLRALNESYRRLIIPLISFKLTRTRMPYHLGQNVYEASMQKKNSEEKKLQVADIQLDKQQERLSKNNDELKKVTSSVLEQNRYLKTELSNSQEALNQAKRYNSSLQMIIQKLSDNYTRLNHKHKRLVNDLLGLSGSSKTLVRLLDKPNAGLVRQFNVLVSAYVKDGLKQKGNEKRTHLKQ